MATYNAIQYTETTATAAMASEVLDFCETQVDFIGGRVTEKQSAEGIAYTAQAFFEHPGDEIEDRHLPDGCRQVFILESQRNALGCDPTA